MSPARSTRPFADKALKRIQAGIHPADQVSGQGCSAGDIYQRGKAIYGGRPQSVGRIVDPVLSARGRLGKVFSPASAKVMANRAMPPQNETPGC